MYTIEAFTEKIHLYANQQQARALLGRFSPQGYPKVTITRWANLPIYSGFLEEVGLSQMVDSLEIKRRNDATSVLELVKIGNYKTLLGCRYVDNLKYFLRDDSFLEAVGLKEPICPKTYTNFLRAIPPEELEKLFQKSVLKAEELGCNDDRGIFALDLSDIEVYGEYFENATPMFSKEGHHVKGFKVAALMRLGSHPIIVSMGIFPGNVKEPAVIFPLIDEARALLGEKAIKLLLLDRGFSSGEMLYQLKHTYGIDWIIPAKDASYVDRAIKSLGDQEWHPVGTRIPQKHLKITSVVTTEVPNCPLQATLILLADTKKHPPKEKPGYPLGAKTKEDKLLAIPGKHLKAFLRTEGLKSSGNKKSLVQRILTESHQGKVELMISLFFKPPRKKVVVDQTIQGYLTSLEVLEKEMLHSTILTYRRRWDIENKAFLVLKEAFNMEYLPSFPWEAIQNHISLVGMTYNLLTLFRKRMGEPLERISPQRLSQEFFQSFQLFVRTGEKMGIIALEHFMELFWEKDKALEELLLSIKNSKSKENYSSFDKGLGI